MTTYTVLLQRPDYIADNYGLDTYMTHVEATTPEDAVNAARYAAIRADAEDSEACADYAVLLVIAGKHADLNPER
jgi:hypothetical protein